MTEILFEKAAQLLKKATTDKGFVAASHQEDNYQRVWSRDGVVCGIAALLSDDATLIATFRNTLQTLWSAQHATGFLPSNVDPFSGKISYGNAAGRADTASWAIIGLLLYTDKTNDTQFAQSLQAQVYKALQVMDVWEFNGKHLIYVPQSADWADEYIQHGYILFDQLLRLWALRLAGKFYKDDVLQKKASKLTEVLEKNFWYREEQEDWYAPSMLHQKESAPQNYWWMGFNPARIYNQFDLQANALALLLELGTTAQQQSVLRHTITLLSEDKLLPSFSPAIQMNDADIKELETNFAYRFRNYPHEFHNAGLWPVWNGWMVAALKKFDSNDEALQLEKNLAQTVSKNDFEMNECYHGLTNKPCGVQQCAWSAAGVIIAAKGNILF